MASEDPPPPPPTTTTNTNSNQLIVPPPSPQSLEEQHDWVTLIPSILERRKLKCTEQTVEGARRLMELGLLGNFTKCAKTTGKNSYMSSQVEESLLESFVEDDYDGALHLMTLDETTTTTTTTTGTDDDNNSNKPIGFVFWREIPQEEMQEWIHWDNLNKKLMGEQRQQQQQQQQNEKTLAIPHEEEQEQQQGTSESLAAAATGDEQQRNKKRRMRRSIQLVRDESVRWLEVASSTNRQSLTTTTTTTTTTTAPATTTTIMERLTHSWVKLELLAVHPEYWKQHIGTLLLACAMYQAYCCNNRGEDGKNAVVDHHHMILHVAGGSDNIPAIRLYEKFGFLPVPQGTIFHKPDKDLYVLGHVGQSLQRLCWPALEV